MENKACPICKKLARQKKNPYLPFCSERCKKIDLGKWALERYRVSGEPIAGEPVEKKPVDEENEKEEE